MKALALVAVTTLVGAGVAPASAAPAVLTYTCQFPDGLRPVPVSITAALPDKISLSLPEDVPVSLVRLAVSVAHKGATAAMDWSGAVPEEGDIVLSSTQVTTEGTFAAGDLDLSIVDGEPVRCAPDAGQDTTLGTLTTPDETEVPTVPEEPAVPSPSATPPAPGVDAVPPPAVLADIPPECGKIPIPPRGRVGCTFVTGYTSVRKLKGSIKVEPGLTNVGIARPVLQLPFLRADNPAELVGGRFPPMKGTFLTFGFVPISASMELSQVGPMNIHTDGLAVAPFTYSVTATSQLSARIYDVKVNGVPLDVGSNCRTATPINATLSGGTPQYTDILKGGPLNGTVDIPPFRGCGVTENLDPLLTGTVSGPGNQVKVVQGTLCVPADPRSPCPPLIPQVPPPSS